MDKFFRAMPHTGCKRGMGPGFQNEKLLQQLGYSVCCAVQIIPSKGFNHAGVRLFGKFGVQRHFGQHGQVVLLAGLVHMAVAKHVDMLAGQST